MHVKGYLKIHTGLVQLRQNRVAHGISREARAIKEGRNKVVPPLIPPDPGVITLMLAAPP